jgi:CXXX repeat peptide maturase
MYAMLENLLVQFVWPDYDFPSEYIEVIESIDHNNIAPAMFLPKGQKTDIAVFSNWRDMNNYSFDDNTAYVLRIDRKELFLNAKAISLNMSRIHRLDIILTDVHEFDEDALMQYELMLDVFRREIQEIYENGGTTQLNLVTDRMMLRSMNNCNAGCETVALAPDGKFYVCPAFYHACEGEYEGTSKKKVSVGDLKTGLHIGNQSLYKVESSPICRICDAYQCRRCVWLNRKTTNEVNIPSHEQCVMSHMEMNCSRKLLNEIRKIGEFLPNVDIVEKGYTDPFDIVIQNKY